MTKITTRAGRTMTAREVKNRAVSAHKYTKGFKSWVSSDAVLEQIENHEEMLCEAVVHGLYIEYLSNPEYWAK